MVVRTRRSSLQEENPPEIEPETADPDTSDNSSETDISRHETHNIDANQPSSDVQAQEIDTPAENPLKRLSRTVTQILSPKSVQPDTQIETSSSPKTDTPSKPAAKDKPAKHPTFAYPPIHETFFTDDEDNEDQQDDPPQIPLQSPDALTSSTRTDFTYPPIEDLTKTLLKYAKNANLRKLSYPTDLVARRRQFNAFMDNLRIVCNISPWTRQVFDLWPKQISYSHPFIGTAIYNLIFTHVCDPCQKHIIDGPPDARTAIFTLRRHCAPLTPDHVERTREAFYSIKQGHNEVATSYLNRIRVLTRDCYHAGIPNTDADLIKRAIRGGSNHHFYAASYQRFDADLRRAELNDEELPAFSELESHLLNIDESRGLTLPSQNQRNYNQHANAARQQSHRPAHRPTFHKQFTRDNIKLSAQFCDLIPNKTAAAIGHQSDPSNQNQHSNRPNNHQNNRRNAPPPRPNHGNRPPLRPTSSNSNNQRRPQSNSTPFRPNPSPNNATNIVCNNCGRTGHYARQCPTATNRPQNNNNRNGGNPRSPTNNENTAPRNQRAYFVTDSSSPHAETTHYHQAFLASLNNNPAFNNGPQSGLTPTCLKWKSTHH
ncbi:hypothetical protein MHU86_2463 [Fragilaria crotonensis]|nr:hypothetical protein MHU86_2463 [Fragilaria crotonensis]